MESTIIESRIIIREKSKYLSVGIYKSLDPKENVNILVVSVDSGTYLASDVSSWEGEVKITGTELPFPSSHNEKCYGKLMSYSIE